MIRKQSRLLVAATLPALLIAMSDACGAVPPETVPAVSQDDLVYDWALQDHGPDANACFRSPADAAVESRMLARVLEELGPKGRAFAAEMVALAAQKIPGADERWRALYVRACLARRTERLRPLMARYSTVVFTKHYDIGGSHYAYTEGQSDAQAERHFRAGTALCLLSVDEAHGTVRTLLDDPKGVIRDPDVSYDGKRILFAWKKSDREDDYHLYEMDAATGGVRQLTFGLGVADYEGAYLPGDDIVFTSTRCVQIVDCWWTEVSNLYACDKDGRYLRRLSFDQVHTNYPTVTDDGRVIYTRWDYNDRGQLFPQPLFQMNPDGTGQTEVYGNNSWFPTTIMHARGIPGTQRIVAILSGHHSHQRGKLAIIDPTVGQQEASGVQLIAPLRETKAVRVDAYGQDGEQWQYPYPVGETHFLVTYDPHKNSNRRYVRPFGLYLMDVDGRRELLARDPKISCNQPVPLAPRERPRLRASVVNHRSRTGTFYVKDVHLGPGLAGVERGTVKRLRVVALEFRAAGVGSNGSGGPAGGAMASTPVSVRNGTWDVKVILGSTPVHEDGSAMFTVPARTPVYFQLVDEKGRVVQSMRSWSTLQPGETFSCVGCHERKSDTPPPAGQTPRALREAPRPLEPFYGPPRGFSFPKEIQPILDRHCIRCHNDRSAVKTIAKAAERASLPPVALKDPKVLLPIESQWQYTTRKPARNWQKEDFNAAGWQTGQAGFGTKGTPGGKVNTLWQTPDIWLRTTLALPTDWDMANKVGAIRFHHDEDVEVFINGRLAAKETGHVAQYKDVLTDICLLRPGANVLAVHCRQTAGGQFIDVGLLEASGSGSPAPVATAEATATEPLPAGAKKAFSLLGETNLDNKSKRHWSDSYLALTANGKPNPTVQWLNVQSIPPMLPPYYAGSAKSGLISMLEEGHNNVKLSREEMEKICCWIDLLVPYCGDYTEANAWSDREKEKYARYQAKRERMDALDRRNIEAMLAGDRTLPDPGGAAAPAGQEGYRNLALNPLDVQGPAAGYPHASSNSEYSNNPAFAARCAIDGKTANRGHGGKYPSWGPDRRKDLWWKVEFGRSVEVDKVVLHIRADFPHDRHWHGATIEFSDGSRERVRIEKTAKPQTFPFAKRTVTWLRFTDLVQEEPPGWCGFSEVEAWGRDVPDQAERYER